MKNKNLLTALIAFSTAFISINASAADSPSKGWTQKDYPEWFYRPQKTNSRAILIDFLEQSIAAKKCIIVHIKGNETHALCDKKHKAIVVNGE